MECKNCLLALQENDNYCSDCGAKVIRNRLTLKNLFEHFSETFLNYDNTFIQTVVNLIKQPKDVIWNYVSGTRKKYINPISFLAICLTFSGFYLFVLRNYFPNAMDFSVIQKNEALLKTTNQISEFLFDYNSFFYFAIVPLLAVISIIVFYNKKFNYTEHIVIYLYTMSLGAFVSSIVSLIVLYLQPSVIFYVGISMNIVLILYHCYLLKQLFDLNLSQLLLKTLLFFVVFVVAYFIFSILIFVAALVFTDLSIQDFAPKH